MRIASRAPSDAPAICAMAMPKPTTHHVDPENKKIESDPMLEAKFNSQFVW